MTARLGWWLFVAFGGVIGGLLGAAISGHRWGEFAALLVAWMLGLAIHAWGELREAMR